MLTEMGHDETGSDESESEETMVLRLTDMVRKQYRCYLEKQLELNALTWSSVKGTNVCDMDLPPKLKEGDIRKCAERLEDKAIKSCMVAKLYQRAMVKIIAEVRHQTKEHRLEDNLHELLKEKASLAISHCSNKGTQTETGFPGTESTNGNENSQYSSLTLEQKIDIFQKRLNKEVVSSEKNLLLRRKRENCNCQRRQRKRSYAEISRRHSEQLNKSLEQTVRLSISSSPSVTPPLQTTYASPIDSELKTNARPNKPAVPEYNQENDNVAKELAQLFSEEKTELDELFGIDPNDETDDPQVSSILKEIENARLSNECEKQPAPSKSDLPKVLDISIPPITNANLAANNSVVPVCRVIASSEKQEQEMHTTTDLRHSLWPCELYMQRRRLTESLNRLIEEDFRWHDVMKWKFNSLFGDDSDDEFASCSPSIELDEVIIGSCIRRISPWMVKHLMKPLDDGLIANRFLFKKLAKKLAHSVIMENQYPDERVIKRAVENFFCLHQDVLSYISEY